MSLGPLQVMIVNFDDPNFTGGIAGDADVWYAADAIGPRQAAELGVTLPD